MDYKEDLNPLKLLLDTGSNGDEFSRKIADFFPAIIYIYDIDSRKLKYINRRVTNMLGYAVEELEGLDNGILPLVYSEDVELVKNELHKFYQLKDEDSHSYTSRLKNKQGHWKYFRTHGTVLNRDDQYQASSILFIAQDITSELESDKLYRDLADYKRMKQENEEFLEYGTWEYDAGTNRFRWSDGMYRLFGYDPEAHRNTLEISEELYRKHIDEEAFEKLHSVRQQMLDSREQKYNWEFTITTNDGNMRQIETSGKLLYDNDGNWVKTIGTSRDVTRLHESQQNLEEKIRVLHRSNKELEEFAYVASHDLNEPLRKITTFIERLNNKYKTELGEDGRLYMNRIVASVDNMRHLIDTLLEFSRTARNSQPLVMTDLNEVLAEVCSDLELKIEESNTKIVADKLPVIEAVPSQMKQVFDNLLNNSIKFKKAGVSPDISIQCNKLTRKQKEEFNLEKENTYYRIVFTDNGIGFEPEYRDKIFQIFQRLHGKAEYPGSGIGLAICRKIADHLNGIIYAEGEPGRGAIFTLILPERQ